MLYPIMTVGLTVAFFAYILYLAFIKKALKQNLKDVVYPGIFFISVWTGLYFFLLT